LDELRTSFRLSDNIDEIDVVVASFDRSFNYHKLNIGFQAIKRGARFFATNADVTCPVADGEIPDAGAVIAALEACSGKKVELVAGKPSSLIIEMALKKLNLPASSCIVIGDRLETDILMGQRTGTATALVMTGVTSKDDLDAVTPKPDFVLNNLADLPAILS
jgi:NagD protein